MDSRSCSGFALGDLELRRTGRCQKFIIITLRTFVMQRLIKYYITNPTLHLNSGISLPPTGSARNLGFIFNSNLTFSDQVSAISRACFYHIRDLRPVLDFSTAHAIGTSLVHSRLDYCNSLYLNLPKTQLNRLQHIQNSLARAVVAAPRSSPADHCSEISCNVK